MNESELKDCPFCGGWANVQLTPLYLQPDKYAYYIMCNSCRSMTGKFLTLKEAIDKWNSRCYSGESFLNL